MGDRAPHEPLRGDAAWKAQKQLVAEHNEAAYKRGRQERAARDAAREERRRAAERNEGANLPTQPGSR
jgi:hypothetical protein